MEDTEFFSLLYQHWAKTTGAEDRFWMPEEYEDRSGRFRLYAVGQDETRKLVASSLSDEDSDFISAVHGCLPDLVRRLTDAVDTAERMDVEKDGLVVRIADLEMQVDSYRQQLGELGELLEASRADTEYWRSR